MRCAQPWRGVLWPQSMVSSMVMQCLLVMAHETGTFCISKDVFALAQRSFGLQSVDDLEKVTASKKKGTEAATTEAAVEKKKKVTTAAAKLVQTGGAMCTSVER